MYRRTFQSRRKSQASVQDEDGRLAGVNGRKANAGTESVSRVNVKFKPPPPHFLQIDISPLYMRENSRPTSDRIAQP